MSFRAGLPRPEPPPAQDRPGLCCTALPPR